MRDLVADRAPEHWIACLQGVQDRLLGRRTMHLELNLATDLRKSPQVRGQDDSNHGSV